ncbi:hypothetical protein ACEPPN_017583 [Leptodophora sp. 'Broadleaf-Isolate-01']
MRFSGILLLLVALGFYCNVIARPLESGCDDIKCQDEKRGVSIALGLRSPGTFKPPLSGPKNDPQPVIGRPGFPDSPTPGAGSSSELNPIGVPTFVAPTSYGTFPQKGQQVVDDLARASGPDNDRDYATKSREYTIVPDTLNSPFAGDQGLTGENIRIPFENMGLKDSEQWTLREVYGTDWHLPPTNVVYHNKDQQAMVVTDTFNDKLGEGFQMENLVFHSEFIFQGWKAAPGGDVSRLKYVTVAQVQNTFSPAVITDARASMTPTPVAGEKVTFSAAAQSDAELQGFFAIAGTDNGKFLFRMLADHHNEMNGLKVIAVHTWDDVPGTPDPTLIWELA